MRIASWRAAWVAVGLLAALTPAAQAQRRLLVGQTETSPTAPSSRSAEIPADVPLVLVTPRPAAVPTARVTEGPVGAARPVVATVQPVVVGGGTSARVSVAASAPGLSIQTTVRVPDGGTALLGGFSTAAESRAEYGATGLGKVPIVGRGFRNVGYGKTLSSRKAVVSVRAIDLREEEFRQTGFRSP